jgi:HK97 family phage portal protein
MGILKSLEWEWKHRGSPTIYDLEGGKKPSADKRHFFENKYDSIEVIRRGTDLIVDAASEIDINITDTLPFKPSHEGVGRIKIKQLLTVLNFRPNPVEDISTFRRQLLMDIILTGNMYQYFDGRDLYHLPAERMEVVPSKTQKISHYLFDGKQEYGLHEIIHTQDNNATSNLVGRSRLYCTKNSINILGEMLAFQENFFKNGTVPGLILTTPNILGTKLKEKLLYQWRQRFNPLTGGKSPMILDGDLKINPLSQVKFNELDFEGSVSSHEMKILKALGVPPILLDSGNNANLRPNIQLFYETTVLPLCNKLISSYEKFFAWDMEPDLAKITALRPELADEGQYLTGLVNGGIMTPNEARFKIRLEADSDPESDKLRIPANIAGSAVDPAQGGRPEEDDDVQEEDEDK